MTLTLREVLALDLFQRARPEVLSGADALDRPVRWVHTSELVEAADLLRGGELLLTTGLGLAGRGPVAQRAYVQRLAAGGAAALGLELGWTFQEAPLELLRAARDEGLPLVVLREIVPFVELTEEVQRRLVHGQVEELRAHEVADRLFGTEQGDLSMWGLVAAVAAELACPVVVETQAGQLVAWAGADSEAEARELLQEGTTTTTELGELDRPWGRLHLVGADGGTRLSLEILQRRVAQLARVMLSDTAEARWQRSAVAQQRQDLLTDLTRGTVHDPTTVTARLELAGASPSDTGYLAVAMTTSEGDTRRLRYAGQAVTSARGGFAVEVDGVVTGIVDHDAETTPYERGGELLQATARVVRQQGGEGRLRIAVSEPVVAPAHLMDALPGVHEALHLAMRLGLTDPVISASETSTDELLAAIADRPELSRPLAERIDPLREHDGGSGADLCETLWTYLTCGSSKTATAARLGLQRQTVHQRLDRIEALIGPVDRPDRHVGLVLALAADRFARRRGIGQGAPGRAGPATDGSQHRKP